MNRVLPLLMVCMLLLLNLPARARSQETRKPRTPACGTWDVVYSPSPNGNGSLVGVAHVPGTVELWSVGNYNANFHWQTLIEHWDGTSWQVIGSPNHPSANHFLYGVAAVAPNDVWSVGRYEPDTGGTSTLILHWDGTNWSTASSPNPATYSGLYAVAAVSATDVWAVGYYYSNGGQFTLIEHWDGSSWSIVPSPNAGNNNLLRAVAVVPNSSAVWAVGFYYRNDGNPSTLVQRWDGAVWTVVPSPDGSTRENYLAGVSSTGPNDAWTVGYYNTPNGLYLPLTEHWDGTSWQVVPSPGLSSSLTALTAVSSLSPTDVWAVGTYYGPGAQLTLAQHWDGIGWQVFSTPNPAGEIEGAVNEFNSVANVLGVGVWAVGDDQVRMPAKPSQTLTAFYCPAGSPTPTSAASRKTHGAADTFDIPLPLSGNVGIECRSGGATNDYQMIINFANPVTVESASVTSGTGSVSNFSGGGTSQITVNLTGITNVQRITVTLFNVNDGTHMGNVPVSMGVLVGDVNGNAAVNASDVSLTKSQVGMAVSGSNFREDVNANGTISATDVAIVKSDVGTSLP